MILSGKTITADDVENYVVPNHDKKKSHYLNDELLVLTRLHDFRDEVEKIFIEFMLQKNGWNVTKTAQALDIQRSHLYNKMERYDIRKTAGGDE